MAIPPAFEGVYPILVTPFDEGEGIDLPSLRRIVRFMALAGADGVVVLGVLGESNRVTDGEREAVIRSSVEAAEGKLPVVVGCSHRGTRATAERCRAARSYGASAVMVTPSKEPIAGEDRIFEYFRRIAEEGGLPVVLQDHPASTEVHMSVPLLLRMVREIPGVACIKEEAPPTPVRVGILKEGMGERAVPVLTGLGGLYGIFDLERGSDGFMTGFAFPEVLIAMVRAMRRGRLEEARSIYGRYLPLIVFEQQPGVAVRKEIYRIRGLIGSGRVRHPGGGLGAGAGEQLRELLSRLLPGEDLSVPIEVRDRGPESGGNGPASGRKGTESRGMGR